MKKGIILGLMMVLAATGSVSASSATNKKTGPKSLNISAVVTLTSTKIVTKQDALVINNVTSKQTTGGVTIKNNTEATGAVTTGSITSNTTIKNNVNNSNTEVSTCNICGSDGSATNKVTGPGSTNIAVVADISLTKVVTVQEGTVINSVNTTQNSGGVVISGNTVSGGDGDPSTGGIDNSVKIVNNVNNASTSVNSTPTP